jgi:hypothetical protein
LCSIGLSYSGYMGKGILLFYIKYKLFLTF